MSLIGPGNLEEKMFEHCERQQLQRRRTTEHAYAISLRCEPNWLK